MTYFGEFSYLNKTNSVTYVSVSHVGAHPGGNKHGVSIQISIYLGKTFLRISRIRKILRFWLESSRGSLYISSFHFPDSGLYLLTLVRTRKFIPSPWYKGGGKMEPLPRVFDMLQYFETILPLVESFWSS